MTGLAGFLLGARSYRLETCETSRNLMAEPWLAETASGTGTRRAMGKRAEGEDAGFSMTVPNWWNAVGVRSSMGMRIDGLGIEGAMLATAQHSLVERASGGEMAVGSLRGRPSSVAREGGAKIAITGLAAVPGQR